MNDPWPCRYARKHFPNVYAHADVQAAAKPKAKKIVKKAAAVDDSADIHTTKSVFRTRVLKVLRC